MLHRLLPAACLLGSLAACTVQDPTHAVASRALAPPPAQGCVAEVATRIAVRPTECAALGRTYTQENILRTGAPDTAHALQQLDPAVTIVYH